MYISRIETLMNQFFKSHWRGLLLFLSVWVTSLYLFSDASLETIVFRVSVSMSVLILMYTYDRIPWFKTQVLHYTQAKQVEKYHWAHDSDLSRLKKVRYVL